MKIVRFVPNKLLAIIVIPTIITLQASKPLLIIKNLEDFPVDLLVINSQMGERLFTIEPHSEINAPDTGNQLINQSQGALLSVRNSRTGQEARALMIDLEEGQIINL